MRDLWFLILSGHRWGSVRCCKVSAHYSSVLRASKDTLFNTVVLYSTKYNTKLINFLDLDIHTVQLFDTLLRLTERTVQLKIELLHPLGLTSATNCRIRITRPTNAIEDTRDPPPSNEQYHR